MKKTKKKQAPKDEWTKGRVQALYKMSANTPDTDKLPRGYGSTHKGKPHEWEWEGPGCEPACLGCNATGTMVERENRGLGRIPGEESGFERQERLDEERDFRNFQRGEEFF